MTPEQIAQAKMEDAQVIRDVLTQRREPLTLENALLVYSVGKRNRPEAWLLTAEELPEYWQKVTEVINA